MVERGVPKFKLKLCIGLLCSFWLTLLLIVGRPLRG
jgi:hypothetical protein